MQRIARAALVGLIIAGLPPDASAHEGDGRAEVLPAEVAPGGSVTVVGSALTPGSEVRIGLVTAEGIRELAAATADDAGELRAEVVMPADMPPRYYELHATDASGIVLTGYVEVLGPQEEGAGESGVPTWLPWAGLAVAAGGAAVLTASRRRRVPSTRSGS